MHIKPALVALKASLVSVLLFNFKTESKPIQIIFPKNKTQPPGSIVMQVVYIRLTTINIKYTKDST